MAGSSPGWPWRLREGFWTWVYISQQVTDEFQAGEFHYLLPSWKILWLPYTLCDGRRSFGSGKASRKTAAVAQGSSTATCPLGRRGKDNNTCICSVTASQISKLAFNLPPFPNYSISLQAPPHLPTQKLSISVSLPQSLCSIFLSWQPHCLHKIMPEASRLVSQTSFHNKNLPAH